jgi:hypothetical protein
MAKHRSHSVAFNRQVAEEFVARWSLHSSSGFEAIPLSVWKRTNAICKASADCFRSTAMPGSAVCRKQRRMTRCNWHSVGRTRGAR